MRIETVGDDTEFLLDEYLVCGVRIPVRLPFALAVDVDDKVTCLQMPVVECYPVVEKVFPKWFAGPRRFWLYRRR